MLSDIFMVVIPIILLVVIFSVVLGTSIKDFRLNKKIKKLYDEYSELINLVINDLVVIDNNTLNAVHEISNRMTKINKLNKDALIFMQEMISELEVLLAPYNSDLAIKIRQRNIKDIIS